MEQTLRNYDDGGTSVILATLLIAVVLLLGYVLFKSAGAASVGNGTVLSPAGITTEPSPSTSGSSASAGS